MPSGALALTFGAKPRGPSFCLNRGGWGLSPDSRHAQILALQLPGNLFFRFYISTSKMGLAPLDLERGLKGSELPIGVARINIFAGHWGESKSRSGIRERGCKEFIGRDNPRTFIGR
jgi:hypothetical protein